MEEQTVIDVGTFVERLLQRQDAFETKINERLATLELQTKEIFEMQQSALAEATRTIGELIAQRTAYRAPADGSN